MDWQALWAPWRKASGKGASLRLRLGERGEQLAAQRLRKEGYVIQETNVRFPVGEIDIVASEGRVLCFIEVRSTSSSEWGGPLASIDAHKRRRLTRAAQWYLKRRAMKPRFRQPQESFLEIRFDVVAIEWHRKEEPRIELIRGAFEAED